MRDRSDVRFNSDRVADYPARASDYCIRYWLIGQMQIFECAEKRLSGLSCEGRCGVPAIETNPINQLYVRVRQAIHIQTKLEFPIIPVGLTFVL